MSNSWARPDPGIRIDIVGVRDLPDGRKEYLMHNEALCNPYYLAVSAPPLRADRPVTCNVGDTYGKYICLALNTWTVR